MDWKKPRKKKLKKMNIGGLFGTINGGVVENSKNYGTITFEADYDDFIGGKLPHLNVGGIAGVANNTTFGKVGNYGKIFIRDIKKFDALEEVLSNTINDASRLAQAKSELESIKTYIGNPSVGEKIERFLNIVNGVKDAVAPFVPYLMSLVP